MRFGARSRAALAALQAVALVVAGAAFVAVAPSAAAGTDPVVLAVGDIACDPLAPAFNGGIGTSSGCRQKAVAAAVHAAGPDAFWPLGDIQYYDGRLDAFQQSYDPSFGDLNPITNPIPGNHEYKTMGAAGYYTYFGARSHPESKGVYSFDIGAWHVLALNSILCTARTPCGPGSAMAKWIAWDIATHPSQCVAAMWHHPLFSAGNNGGYLPMVPVWNQLNSYGVDLVLNGHDHQYQRFLPLGDATIGADGKLASPTIAPDGQGMVEMVLGMGGEDNFNLNYHSPDAGTVSALAASATNSNPAVFGAEKLTLHATGYDYAFDPAAGTTYSDSGTTACRAKTPPSGLPPQPRGVSAARSGDGSATVSWTAPVLAGTPDTTFKVVSTPGDKTCTVVNGTSCVLTQLTNGTAYSFTVTSDNAVARVASAASGPLVVATRPSRPGTPSAVLGPLSATLAWTAPTYDGGLSVTGYTTTASPGGASCSTAGALTCTIGGLTSGVSYSFAVAATNDAGTSVSSIGSVPMKVFAAASPAITGVQRTGDGAVSVSATETTTWSTPATGFVVTSAPGAKKCTITLPAVACTVTGLTDGASYTFTAAAVTSLGTSAPSAPSGVIVAATHPARPGSPVVVLGLRSAALTWSAPTTDGGLPVTAYTATASPGGLTCTTTGGTSCIVEGLSSGVSYSFAVVAANDAGPSASGIGSAPVKAVAAAPPAVLAVSRVGDGAILVTAVETTSWGAAPTGYTIVSSPGAKKCTISVPDSSCVVTGLTNGTSYTFAATTVNELGTSSPSAASTAIVPAVAPTRPGVPTVSLGLLSAMLTWASPAYYGGLPVESYVVTATPGGLMCSTGGDLSCTIIGLTAGVSYSFSVVANNDAGTSVSGPGSAPVKAVSAPPPVVTGTSRAGDGAISVSVADVSSWSVPATGYVILSTPAAKKCTITLPATSCTITGLTNGTAYQFSASTINALGTSAPSPLSAALVAGKAPGRPGTAVATANGGGTMSVLWTAPATDGGLPITRYVVVSAPGAKTCATTGALSCTVTGLTPGTAYSFSVVATNEAGSSPSSTGSTPVKAA